MEAKPTIEHRITEWRNHLHGHESIHSPDTEELEDHLRSQMEELQSSGLSDEEAFLVAVKRMGALDSVSREFAREYSERLWKQLLFPPQAGQPASGIDRDALIALIAAIGAAVVIKIPALFGLHFDGSPGAESFYVRNISLLILPFLAGFFAFQRGLDSRRQTLLIAPFLVLALVMNTLPFVRLGSTELLAALHLPIVLWFTLGFAYMNGRWRSHLQRMNLVRFSGEWAIYLALIALGGGVLIGFTLLLFESIDVDAEPFVQSWLLPCGVAGAVVIAGWLVEAKKSIIENMAPVLTRLFTPLFTLLLLSFIIAMIVSGTGIHIERDLLIGFDLLLVLILALLLYSISARDPETAPGLFDRLQLLLVLSALLVDILALWAVAVRISEFGWSPNKVAALGLNLILLVNLSWSAVLYARFLLGRAHFGALERWQTAYIPVYPIWAATVVIIFPFLFNFQ